MRSLTTKFLRGYFLVFHMSSGLRCNFHSYLKLGVFRVVVTVYGRPIGGVGLGLGVFRFHVYYKAYHIFHWCDLCGAPRIRGVNL